jgi:hypothetical protein
MGTSECLAQAQRALYLSAYGFLGLSTKFLNSSRDTGEPSLATRLYEKEVPVQADKQRPVGSTKIGMSSTSTNSVPGGTLVQSNVIATSKFLIEILSDQADLCAAAQVIRLHECGTSPADLLIEQRR